MARMLQSGGRYPRSRAREAPRVHVHSVIKVSSSIRVLDASDSRRLDEMVHGELASSVIRSISSTLRSSSLASPSPHKFKMSVRKETITIETPSRVAELLHVIRQESVVVETLGTLS